MTTLDSDGARLLEHFRDLEGPAALQPVADAEGSDPTDSVRITVDAARRVRRVRVTDRERLRTPAGFAAAVVAAYTAADAARGAASLEASGAAGDWVRWAEEVRTGQHPLDRGRRPGVRRDDARPGAASFQHPRERTGRADNGYLEITRDQRGAVVAVLADPEWLAGASDPHIERAVEQAFDSGRGEAR